MDSPADSRQPRPLRALANSCMFLSIALPALLLAATAQPAALPAGPVSQGQASERPLARIAIESTAVESLAEDLRAHGFDVLDSQPAPGRLELIVTDDELQRLTRMGLAPVELERGRPLGEVLGAGQLALGSTVPVGYPDLATIELNLIAYAAAHPGIARVVNLTQTYNTPTTFEGRSLLALVISDNVDVEEDEPAVLLVSSHHSREIVTPLVALEAIGRLIGGYGSDPGITAAVNSQEIWIIPVQNPDGYNHVFNVDSFWRKNRRIFSIGVGVDLNRNYPTGWGTGCGGSTQPDQSTYQGPAPASEPETQALIALSEDRHFAKVLDFHSFGKETRYGYGCWTHPLTGFLAAEASAISLAAGWSGITGSSCCLAGQIHYQMSSGAHAFLLETASAFQPDYNTGLQEAAAVWNGIEHTLTRELSLAGNVVDAATLLPLDATLDVSGVTFLNGESFGSGGPFGRYHATLPPGDYTLTFSAPGYLASVHPVTVAMGAPVELDVALLPEGNAWQNLAGGSLGSSGTPHLLGTGSLAPGSPVGFSLSSAVPNALLLAWVSGSSTPLPLAGGTLFATPYLQQALFFANSTGALDLASAWPAGLPVGTQVWVQFLCQDGSVPEGFTLSNALLGTTP